MPTVESPSVDELEQRTTALEALLTAASSTVAAAVAAKVTEQTGSAFAATALIPALWSVQVGAEASKIITDAYVDAATTVFDAVNEAGALAARRVSTRAARSAVADARARVLALGTEMQRAARAEVARDVVASDETHATFVSRVTSAAKLAPSKLSFTARTEVVAATQSGMLAQADLLRDYVKVTRVWQSQHDERTRLWHRAADGQHVVGFKPFHVGNSWLLAPGVAAPGRPLDVGDLCNCRCGVKYMFDIITESSSASTSLEAPVSTLQPGDMALVAAAAKWNPSKHPRGKDGKFIHKGFTQEFLASPTPTVGKLVPAVQNISDKDWNNLTDAQQDYIASNVEKLPKQSATYGALKKKLDNLGYTSPAAGTSATPKPQVSPTAKSVPAHKGAAPGSPAKVSTPLVWGKYTDGDVILESSDGKSRVTWDGTVKKYATQSKDANGKWVTDKLDTKKSFYESNKGSTAWVVPGGAAAGHTQLSTVQPSATSASTPKPKPKPTSEPVNVPTPSPAPAPVPTPAPVSAPVPTPTSTPTVTPTTTPGLPADFTIDGTVLNANTLDKLLKDAPANSVIMQRVSTLGTSTTSVRVVKTDKNKFVTQQLQPSGDWVVTGITNDYNIISEVQGSSAWKINSSLIPNITKSSGSVVSDWSAHLKQKFEPGDVVATHKSGLQRVVKSSTSLGNNFYDIQTLDTTTGTWKASWYGINVPEEYFTNDSFTYENSSEYVAGKPSKPSVSPSLPALGGKPLKYASEDVISKWLPLLSIKKHDIGDVVAVHSSGNLRIISLTDHTAATKKYMIEKWNPQSQKWTTAGSDLSPSMTHSMATSVGGDWVVPPSGGEPHPLKKLKVTPPTSPASTPTVTSPAVPVPTPAAPVTPTGGGSDITSIPDYVKVDMKATLKPDKVGYWSKPEKIWDSVKKIQSKYPDPSNPGNSKYSPMQIFKALDSTLKTSDPSPFETKMVKWAGTPSGQAYVKKSSGSAASVSTPTPVSVATPTTVPTSTTTPLVESKFPGITANFNYANAWKTGKHVTSAQVVSNLKSSNHLDVVAINVKGSVEHRVVRSSDDPVTGEMRFYVQKRDNNNTLGWDVVTKPGMDSSGLLKTANDLNKFFPGLKFNSTLGITSSTSVTPSVPTPTPVATPANVGLATDDISHLTADQKSLIYSAFKKNPSTYLTSSPLALFNAAKKTSSDNNLSIMQTLKVIDEVGAAKVGVPNANSFEKKVSDWLGTSQGTAIASGESVSKSTAKVLDYSPGISPDGIPSFDDSSNLTYNPMTVAAAHKFEAEVLKQSLLPKEQISALKTYTGGVYGAINGYLYGSTATITTTNLTTAKNIQKAMRPSNQPMLLHRGVNFNGIANSTSLEDLKSKVGQTWLSGGFFSTSVGTKAAFSGKPVALEIEAPPGTPMAWMEQIIQGPYGKSPLTKYPGENEMLLAAGLSYRIISVKSVGGKAVVRLRVVPPSEKVTV